MAIQTAIARAAILLRMIEKGLYLITHRPVMPATAQGDSQVMWTFPNGGRLHSAHLTVPNNLGAGATLQLQKRDGATGVAVNITQATTAATAQTVSSSGAVAGTALVPIDFNAGDTIEVLVGGAAVTTAAGIIADVSVQHA